MTSDIMFYHAIETNMIAVLFELLKKSFKDNKRCLVCIDTPENATNISESLWAFQDNFILPHGLITEDMPDKQPILLTHNTDNINNADYIFFIGLIQITDTEHFKRCIVIFDDTSEDIKLHTREQFKLLKKNNVTLKYYQQTNGKWHLR